MAKSGLKHIDVGAELTKTEWESEDSHELLHGSSFPGTPVERQLFYRDDEHKWYIYTGAAWTELTRGGSGMSGGGTLRSRAAASRSSVSRGRSSLRQGGIVADAALICR